MSSILLCSISCTVLVLSQAVVAGEYVRPPSGPYQSSVIINQNVDSIESSGQVYKFPSDSLIKADKPAESIFLSDRLKQNQHSVKIPETVQNPVYPDQDTIKTKPQITPTSRPAVDNFSINPWAADTFSNTNTYQQTFYPGNSYQGNNYQGNNYQGNNYQGNGGYQQYSYPQQYPYEYNNQNNYMNNPLNGMPSPWSAMPMQPFFSGK